MTLNQFIEKLEGIREAEGGNIQVFITAGGQDSIIDDVRVDKAEVLVNEHIFLGHCEEYHQCVLVVGN